MSLLPTLPFFVTPYPDEILGSWLFRLQVHNHSALIQNFVSQATRRNIGTLGWRDIVKPSPEFQQLLEALGTTYGTAMMEFTTYPYWLRFHSAARFDLMNQNNPSEIPALILKDRRESISRLRYLLPNLVRMCPVCLAEDFERYGEPYLHRAHHLPFVKICHKHGTALISRCPKCNQIFRMKSTFVYAQILCTCNYDLRCIRSEKVPQQKPWKRLACYSAEILFSKEPIDECSRFYKFFDSRLTLSGVKERPELLEYLAGIYGTDGAKAMLTLAPQRSDAYTHSLIGSVSKQEFRAPQICAFLATLDLSFNQSNTRYAKFMAKNGAETSNGLNAHQDSTRPRIPQSIAEARSYVVESEKSIGKSIIRSFLYRRYKTLFWYLTLFDQAWFDENYPPGGRGATEHLPSIESDRSSILRAISKAPENRGVTVWKNLAQQAFFRASLRDIKWLEDRKRETARKIKKDKLARKREYLQACVNDVKQAIERIQAIKGHPANVSPSEIAPYTSLNEAQLRHFFANNPDMRKHIISGATDFAMEKNIDDSA